MGKKENKTSGPGKVQVFELTMDNPEDQDELNRQLRKLGEPDVCTATKTGCTTQGESGGERRAAGQEKDPQPGLNG
jgi:hypothetical protein